MLILLVIVAAVIGTACLSLALFARENRPYDSHLCEAVREWLAPRRGQIFLVGVVFFVPLLLLVAYWRLSS